MEHLWNKAGGGGCFAGPSRNVMEQIRNTCLSPHVGSRSVGRHHAQPGADTPDLLLGIHALGRVEVLPHARVVPQQRRGAMAELPGDVLGRLAFVDEQRCEAGSQVAGADPLRAVLVAGGEASRSGG